MSTNKDPRRLFTEEQKKEMFVRQGGLCHDCGEPLKENAGHHVISHAEGGETEIENGALVCPSCHAVRHSKAWKLLSRMVVTCDPRFKWQTRGLFKFVSDVLDERKLTPVEAVMAGGKTRFSVQCMMLLRELSGVSTTVVVVPTRSIAEGYEQEIRAMQPGLAPDAIRKHLVPKNATKSFQVPHEDWIICTYAEATKTKNVDFMAQCFRIWKQEHWGFGLICDEIHHTNTSGGGWGVVERYSAHAEHTIVQTGTPFRTSDDKIALMPYGLLGEPLVNITYKIDEALSARNVRPVTFRWIDGDLTDGITYYERVGDEKVERHADRLEDIPAPLQAGVVRELMEPGRGAFWLALHREMVATMNELREYGPTSQAKGLIVSDVGYDKLVKERRTVELTAMAWKRHGEVQTPTVITSDNPEAQGLIREFRNNSAARYIAAMNMVSEGTNIPWLMVLGLFRPIQSEMLFRQLVGRVMRTTCGGASYEFGRVILPRTSEHLKFAEIFESANARVLGKCKKCGQEKPCLCGTGEGPGGEGPTPGQPVVVSAWTGVDVHAASGTAEGKHVGEEYIEDAKAAIRDSGSRADEVLMGTLLASLERRGKWKPTSTTPTVMIANRDDIEAQLLGLLAKRARLENQNLEDSNRTAYRILGVDTTADFQLMTESQLRHACFAVQDMIRESIEKSPGGAGSDGPQSDGGGNAPASTRPAGLF